MRFKWTLYFFKLQFLNLKTDCYCRDFNMEGILKVSRFCL